MSDTSNNSATFFSPGWPPGRVANGIVTYVGALKDALVAQGKQVHVMSASVADAADNAPTFDMAALPNRKRIRLLLRALGKVPFVEPTGAALALQLASGLRGLQAKGLQPGLLEVEESFGAAWYLQQMIDLPLVVRLHGPWFLNGNALGLEQDAAFALRDATERRCMRDADGLTAPSRDVLEAVRRKHGLALPNAAVIPNPGPTIEPARRWTPATSDKQTILFVGRFDRHKGGDIMLDAFVHIAAACPQARLVFVGPDRGLRDDSGTQFDLPTYVRTKLPPAVQARVDVRGPLAGDAIEPLRRSACVTVVASRYENFGLALVEALSFGCPTVASRTGGNPEILLDQNTGLLFTPEDPAALAAAVVALYNDPARAAAFGEAAANDMAVRLGPARVASLTWDYFESVWARYHSRKRPLRWLLPLLT
ncbi:MAG: glycosyltransferase family 4 protein [Deltaproteobacteria bacterium]|nr:glycosyltransferase family 4 protein [Deltaproteobacteria bacterium]